MNFNEHKKIYLSSLVSTSLVLGMLLYPASGFFSPLNTLNSKNANLASLSAGDLFADEVSGQEANSSELSSDSENTDLDSSNSEQIEAEDEDLPHETVSPEIVASYKKESPSSKNFVSGQQNAISYRNEQLNIAFDLPNGFMLYPPNMLAYLVAADEEDINQVPFDFSFFAQTYEFIAMKDGAYPKLTLVVEKEIKDNISLDDYVISYSSALKNLGYQTNPVTDSSKNIAGEDYKHLSFSIEEDSETIIQDFYFRKINDLLIYFTASYKAGEEAEMEALFAGVSTYKDASPLAENSLVKDPGSGKSFKSDDSDTLFNPNRLSDDNKDSGKDREEDPKQINFNLSEADANLNSDFTFARERLFLPSSYLKLQEKGLFINDEAMNPEQQVEPKSFVNDVDVKSKNVFPYSVKLFFYNDGDEAVSLNKAKVYGLELDAREKIALGSGLENSSESISESESTTESTSAPSDTNASNTGLYTKQSLLNDDELKLNLNDSINNSIFQAGLTFTSSNSDVKSFFDKLASNKDNKVKESNEGDLTIYSALNNKGTFLQMTVDKNSGLLAYKLLNFSLDENNLPQDILNVFASV